MTPQPISAAKVREFVSMTGRTNNRTGPIITWASLIAEEVQRLRRDTGLRHGRAGTRNTRY